MAKGVRSARRLTYAAFFLAVVSLVAGQADTQHDVPLEVVKAAQPASSEPVRPRASKCILIYLTKC